MNAEDRSTALDVNKTVAELRAQRAFVVQTEAQYMFCHMCVLDGQRAMFDEANRDKWSKDLQVRESTASEPIVFSLSASSTAPLPTRRHSG